MAAGKKVKKAGTARSAVEVELPSVDESRVALSPALSNALERSRSLLCAMRERPPQLLHMEGGSVSSRVALALWWAALLNCEGDERPCLVCPSCLRIGARMHPDLFLLDGRISSIKIDEVRALRPVLGEHPRFGLRRVVILAEAQALGIEAANSLLKVLEEPCPDTCFVFTAPQRERLLPTLVSRGWVITLPWLQPGDPLSEELSLWDQALARFAVEGRGWFDLSQLRSGLDAAKAQQVVLVGRKALADCISGRGGGKLSSVFRSLPEVCLFELNEIFSESEDALQAQVNPLLALDDMACGVYSLARRALRNS